MPGSGQAPQRWRALLWLTAGVLLIHVWLLAGSWPGWHDSPTQAEAPLKAAATASTAAGQSGQGGGNIPQASPVTIGSVRIVPTPQPFADNTPAAPDVSPRPPRPAANVLRAEPTQAAQNPPAPSDPDEVPAAASPVESPVGQVAGDPPPLNKPPSEAPGAPPPDVVLVAAAPAPTPVVLTSTNRTPLPPAQPPGPADLRYEVFGRAKGLRYSADAHLRWKPSGSRYTAELEINAFLVGNRVQTSRGRLDSQGLAPERFGDRRRGTEKATHFDQAGQRIRFSSNAPDAPLLPGAQDRLSVFLQLAALFQARPDGYAAGQTVRLQVAGTGDAETWSFQVGPEETLALPAGSVIARRLTRPPRHEHDNTVDIWLAPELQHLPVRIRITEPDGDLADQQLRQRPP